MIKNLAATVNVVDIILCIGMFIYAKKALHMFRGGMNQRALQILLMSVTLFLVAALARGASIWNILTPELNFIGISIRTIAFACLFISFVLVVRNWTNFGTISTPTEL